MKLYVLEAADLGHTLGESFLQDRLSRSDLLRYRSIRPPKRRHQFLLGRALLAYALDRERGVGKARASISHHGNYACVALSHEERIGVDVHTGSFYPEMVARRFFTPNENRWLQELPSTSRANGFGALWTIKEAVCKARGTGLRFPLPALRVPPGCDGRCRQWRWALVSLSPDTVVAVAWDGTDSPLHHESLIRVAVGDLLAASNGNAH